MYVPSQKPHESINPNRHYASPQPKQKMIPAPEEELIAEHSTDVLAHWQAPEFEVYERDSRWYALVGLFLLAVISWALYTNSPVMAITFILIGVVGYIHLHREPDVLDFMITYEGVVAGREIYDFDNIASFWILYEPEYKKVISLEMKSGFVQFIHIPIHEENPTEIRKMLLKFLPEKKHEPGIMELMERVLRI